MPVGSLLVAIRGHVMRGGHVAVHAGEDVIFGRGPAGVFGALRRRVRPWTRTQCLMVLMGNRRRAGGRGQEEQGDEPRIEFLPSPPENPHRS